MEDLRKNTIEGWVEENLQGDPIYASVDYRIIGVENVHCTPYEDQLQRGRLVTYIQSMAPETAENTYYLDVFKEARAEYEQGLKRERIDLDRAGCNIVNRHLLDKTSAELQEIANGEGSYMRDIQTLCRNPRLVGKIETVGKLLKLSAGILVGRYVRRLLMFVLALFGFALR